MPYSSWCSSLRSMEPHIRSGLQFGSGLPRCNNRNNSSTCLIKQCSNFCLVTNQDRSLVLQMLKQAPGRERKKKRLLFIKHWFHRSARTSPTANQNPSLQGDKQTVIAHARAEERDTTPRAKRQMFWLLVPYSIYPTPLLFHYVIIAG